MLTAMAIDLSRMRTAINALGASVVITIGFVVAASVLSTGLSPLLIVSALFSALFFTPMWLVLFLGGLLIPNRFERTTALASVVALLLVWYLALMPCLGESCTTGGVRMPALGFVPILGVLALAIVANVTFWWSLRVASRLRQAA